jgi:hypothetical protein
MNQELIAMLPGFTNIQSHVIRGITHTQIRVVGTDTRIRKPGFVADVYINRRTQQVSIARVDTGDTMLLYSILSVLSRFQF